VARRRGANPLTLPDAVVLDAEGLSAAAAGSPRARAELDLAERLGAKVFVSTVTLTETLRGGRRDASVHRLLKGVVQQPVTSELGRAAGELLGRTRRDDTVDAIVAVTASEVGRKARILTSDPGDLRALTADMDGVTIVGL
jgi:predicted nucleic acid-binding protein